MRYGSVCSGIEAATVAWHQLGWEPAWFSEIEPFPCAVLAHHYPSVLNLGDMTTIAARILAGEVEAPDVLVGGTPCQAFSVAGLRQSLGDARGNLALAFVRLADAIDAARHLAGKPPAYVLWENVPGVLSVRDNAFGAFLGGLVGADDALVPPKRWGGAGVVAGPSRVAAWRTLDAQHFGVAQRRRRVFVLARGGPRAWSAADALLPLSPRLSWHPPPRGKAGTRIARAPAGGAHFDRDEGTVARALRASDGRSGGNTEGDGALLVAEPEVYQCHGNNVGPAGTLRAGNGGVTGGVPFLAEPLAGPAGTLRAGNGGVAEALDPTRPTPEEAAAGRRFLDALDEGRDPDQADAALTDAYWARQPVPFDTTQITHRENRSRPEPGDPSPTLAKQGHPPAIAFHVTQDPISSSGATPALGCGNALGCGTLGVATPIDIRNALREDGATGVGTPGTGVGEPGAPANTLGTAALQGVAHGMAVRRLTPRECERLQGFPDDYTLIPWGKKIRPEKLDIDWVKYLMRGGRMTREECAQAVSDGPRYRALGNSMATVVMLHVGRGVQRVEEGA